MVRLQSSTTILNMAGYSADGDSPEMSKQSVRKAKAEADIAEAKAREINEATGDNTRIVINNNVPKEDENADS